MLRFNLLVAAIGLTLLAPSAVRSDPPATAPAVQRVLCFGDSITEGGMLPAKDKGSLWLATVEKQSGGKLQLINEGKGGRPTNSVEEFRAVLKKRDGAFDTLLISLGTNDSRDITDKCVPTAVKNVRQMIEMAHDKMPKLRILLVGPPNINKNALGPTKPIANEREQKLKDIGAAFKELAKDTGSEYVTLFGAVPDECLLKDGVHPDAAGNDAIAKVLLPALLP